MNTFTQYAHRTTRADSRRVRPPHPPRAQVSVAGVSACFVSPSSTGGKSSSAGFPSRRPRRGLCKTLQGLLRNGVPVKSAAAREPPGSVGAIGAGVLFCLATVAAVQFLKPGDMVPTTPLRTLAAHVAPPKPLVTASAAADAFGQSGNVKGRLGLPGRA